MIMIILLIITQIRSVISHGLKPLVSVVTETHLCFKVGLEHSVVIAPVHLKGLNWSVEAEP